MRLRRNKKTEYGLGRRVQFDERSKNYPMSDLLTVEPIVYNKTWRRPPALDQGQTPECVGYSTYGLIQSQPNTSLTPYDVRKLATPDEIYHAAQLLDEWPGEAYDGTSVLAGMKAAQSKGYIPAYRWCFSTDEVLQTLAFKGPVVIGITWYNSMFTQVDLDPGFVPRRMKVDKTSGVAGGHAIELHGIVPARSLVIGTNSWGVGWGDEGRFYLTYDDLDMLLADNGEAVTATAM